MVRFQSTRPVRGATITEIFRGVCHRVSIHAPHAGRDRASAAILTPSKVSIHAPHAGRDQCLWASARYHPCFNPRAPCGARRAQVDKIPLGGGFNPRAPCGARPCVRRVRSSAHGFQSTRPMRGATHCIYFVCNNAMFQSTRPMRGATAERWIEEQREKVSIHAPHAGRDIALVFLASSCLCFNPRAPCGARRYCRECTCRKCRFNPRAPCGARR